MEKTNQYLRQAIILVIAVLVLAGLYFTSRHSYLLFHSLAEVFSIVIACGIFMIALNTRQFMDNGYLLFVGVSLLFVSTLDLLHMLGYKGMLFFQQYGANLPTQLWIAARYLQSLTLLMAPLFLNRKIKISLLLGIYTGVLVFLLMAIFKWDIFPVCFSETQGLSAFKKISEYVICLILAGAILFLIQNRQYFGKVILNWLVASIGFTIVSELCFTFYSDSYGMFNLIGHFFKIVAYYCFYKAIIEAGLTLPYEFLFRELKRNEERYRNLFTHMVDGFARHKMVYDTNGRPKDYVFLEVNDAFEQLTGLRRSEIIGKRVTQVVPGIEKEPADWINVYGQVAETGVPLRFENYSETLEKWFSVMAYSREKGAFVTVFEDITYRKEADAALKRSHDELELRVSERTKELEAYAAQLEWKNRELEEFAYVASHDLQEPLRKIQVFGSLLKRAQKTGSLKKMPCMWIG